MNAKLKKLKCCGKQQRTEGLKVGNVFADFQKQIRLQAVWVNDLRTKKKIGKNIKQTNFQ